MEVPQKLFDTQRKSLSTQHQDLGVRVTMTMPKGLKVLGWVQTLAHTMDPIKVVIRYDEGVEPLSPKQEKGFKFVLRKGRFVLHKGK
ncbi:hypothetical protein D3C81_304850 [compost metagenome]